MGKPRIGIGRSEPPFEIFDFRLTIGDSNLTSNRNRKSRIANYCETTQNLEINETEGLDMSVSASYREFVLEQLGAVAPVTARSMFGGVGVYSGGLFFALMDDDRLFFKVDDSNRGDYEAKGMGAFHPYGDERAMGYFEVPEDILEDSEALGGWMRKALKVAATKGKGRKKKSG